MNAQTLKCPSVESAKLINKLLRQSGRQRAAKRPVAKGCKAAGNDRKIFPVAKQMQIRYIVHWSLGLNRLRAADVNLRLSRAVYHEVDQIHQDVDYTHTHKNQRFARAQNPGK